MDADDDQQFCLRWNNFQANITSQFEALRDDEDFTDVTIAVEGQRLQAHKVVLSACSPYFKELFKSNPCSHPIIFMRDVEARHVVALMEFMYAGEVNVAQAHLSSFLKTAESLKIRGLTDTSNDLNQRDDDTLFLNPQPSKSTATDTKSRRSALNAAVACSSTVTSSEDVGTTDAKDDPPAPPTKRQCKTDDALRTEERLTRIEETVCATNPFDLDIEKGLQPKIELPDYLSDEERDDGRSFFHTNSDLTGGMEIIQQGKLLNVKDVHPETNYGSDSRKLHSLDPRPCEECGRVYSNLSNLRQHMKLIHYPTFVSCPVCAKSFKTDLYLRRHMITTHETTNYRHSSSRLVRQVAGNCGSHVSVAKAIAGDGKFGPSKHGYGGL